MSGKRRDGAGRERISEHSRVQAWSRRRCRETSLLNDGTKLDHQLCQVRRDPARFDIFLIGQDLSSPEGQKNLSDLERRRDEI